MYGKIDHREGMFPVNFVKALKELPKPTSELLDSRKFFGICQLYIMHRIASNFHQTNILKVKFKSRFYFRHTCTLRKLNLDEILRLVKNCVYVKLIFLQEYEGDNGRLRNNFYFR